MKPHPGTLALLVGLSVAGLVSSRVHARPAAAIPEVVLVMDLSASMNFGAQDGMFPPCSPPASSVPGPTGTGYERSRYDVALEILTGTFNNYWCTYELALAIADIGDPPEYIGKWAKLGPTITQATDGLIDAYAQTAKFVLMFTDNRQFPVSSPDNSFGPSFTSLFGMANVGIRDPAIDFQSQDVEVSDSPSMVQYSNDNVQIKLHQSIPMGPTPLGPMLDDVNEWFGPGPYMNGYHQGYDSTTGAGDQYFECRPRVVILFTDGQSNQYEGTWGYPTAEEAAGKLYAKGIPVYVVGIPDTTQPIPQSLFDIATAGGTGAPIMGSPALVRQALAQVLAGDPMETRVYTAPLLTTDTQNLKDVGYRYEAASNIRNVPIFPMNGNLARRVLRCDKTCQDPLNPGDAGVCEIVSVSKVLNDRTGARKLLTQKDGLVVNLLSGALSPDDMGLPTSGLVPDVDYDNKIDSCVVDPKKFWDLSKPGHRKQYMKQLLNNVDNTGPHACNQQWRLGAPGPSQHQILAPAVAVAISDLGYLDYVNAPTPLSGPFVGGNPPGSKDRPTMLFFGTHDGFVHGFRADTKTATPGPNTYLSNTTLDDELWAFMPYHNMGRLTNIEQLRDPAKGLMVGPVLAQHVRLRRRNPAVETKASGALAWRAVLIAGDGDYPGFTALDVTAPESPRLLWEITPDMWCWGDLPLPDIATPRACDTTTKPYAKLQSARTRATVGTVFANTGSGVEERSVAVIAGGTTGLAGAQRVAYVVDLATGRMLQEFSASKSNIHTTGMTAGGTFTMDMHQFDTTPACYNTFADTFMTRCFLADTGGQIWRMDLSSTNPSEWKITWFHDLYSGPDAPAAITKTIDDPTRIGVMAMPSTSLDPTGSELVLVYGAGSVIDAAPKGFQRPVYSVTETIPTSASGVVIGAVKGKVNWVKLLDQSEVFIGPSVVFGGDAYWTTYIGPGGGSACGITAVGAAYLWGVDYTLTSSAADKTSVIGAFLLNPSAASPSQQPTKATRVFIGTTTPSPALVEQRPPCVNGCALTDNTCTGGVASGAGLSAIQNPNYQLSVATSTPATQGTGTLPPNSTFTPPTGMATHALQTPTSALVLTGWDVLLD